jgi:very-short-patch-repair endonuclease
MSCSPTRKKLCGQLSCEICLNRSFHTHPKAQFWSSKNELIPLEVHKNSNKKFWFDCNDCGHEILVNLNNITSGQWCMYCNKSVLCNSSSCEFCFNKSFASHPMAVRWSSRNGVSPRQITKGADSKYWFNCEVCHHEFDTKPYSITNNNHCPYCTNQRLCDNDDCSYCFNKSCASHTISEAWSSKNVLKPREVFLQSNKKMIFNCLECCHEYTTTVTHYFNRDGSCAYCANLKLCNNTDCKQCYEKSFASHQKVLCWSTKNTVSPREVFKSSDSKKYIFDCNVCHNEFAMVVYNITNGAWCPFCKNKTEGRVQEFLKSVYEDYKYQLRFDWCRYSKTNNIMPIDFGLVDKKIVIELDGEQHFSQISNWDSPESVQSKDVEKIKYCLENGYSIIHIYQVDVWKNTYNWKEFIKCLVKDLELEKEPICVFIADDGKYDKHIEKLQGSIKYKTINPKL